MARTLVGVCVALLALASSTCAAPARDASPPQLAQNQNIAVPALPAALQAQVDQAVQQALAANAGASPATIATAVAAAVNQILVANAAGIAADPTLAASIAQEAVSYAASSAGIDPATLVQISSNVASAAASAAPTASASVFAAVIEALPASLQNQQNETQIAQAIDQAVPGQQITASITPPATGKFGKSAALQSEQHAGQPDRSASAASTSADTGVYKRRHRPELHGGEFRLRPQLRLGRW